MKSKLNFFIINNLFSLPLVVGSRSQGEGSWVLSSGEGLAGITGHPVRLGKRTYLHVVTTDLCNTVKGQGAQIINDTSQNSPCLKNGLQNNPC